MSAHTCTTLAEGCYRCDPTRAEIASIEAEIRIEAQDAWLAYRDGLDLTAHTSGLKRRTTLRRDFIAGYLAANDIAP